MVVGNKDYVRETNIGDEDMMIISLANKGYDTITNLRNMDSKELLDILEFEIIKASIEQKIIKDSQRGNSQ